MKKIYQRTKHGRFKKCSPRYAVVQAVAWCGLPLLVTVPVTAQDRNPNPMAEALVPKVTLKGDPATWQSGEIKLNDVLFDLSRPEMLKGSPFEDTVRRDLLKAMIDYGNAGISLSDALKDNTKATKRWVGYAYAAAGDERAVPLLEDVLSQTPKPVPTKAKAVDLTYLLICLSSYYEKKGDLIKAAETQLRALEYLKEGEMPKDPVGAKVPVAGTVANHLASAARLYNRAGEADKARQCYEQVAKYGYGWTTGMVLYDQAQQLMDQGKHEEARRLLQQPVEGQYADQIKVGLAVALGASYYRTGDLDLAQTYAQQAVQDYGALANPLEGEGLQELVSNSKERLEWLEKWKKSSFIVTPGELNFTVPLPGSISKTLSLHALKDIPFTVECDDARVQVGIVEAGRQEEFSFAKNVSIEAQLSAFAPQKSFETVLKVGSPVFPDFSLLIPVKVEVVSAPE